MQDAIQAKEAEAMKTLAACSELSVPLGGKKFKLQITDVTPGRPESKTACICLWANDMKEALEMAAGLIPHGAMPSPANINTPKTCKTPFK